jgi:hypothetical protein
VRSTSRLAPFLKSLRGIHGRFLFAMCFVPSSCYRLSDSARVSFFLALPACLSACLSSCFSRTEARKEIERRAAQAKERKRRELAAANAQREAVFEAVKADDVDALRQVVASAGAEVLHLRDRTGTTPLEVAVSLKKTGACALLADVADDADLTAEAEALHTRGRNGNGNGGGGGASPAGRRGVLGARLKALRKAAAEISAFKAEVGMELRAKKRPLGHRNMVADAYYPCVVVGVNEDGSLRVRYPDEGRRGIEDDALTVDLVDLSSVPRRRPAKGSGGGGGGGGSANDSVRDALADLF